MKNYGLLEQKELRAKDWRFGGVTGADHIVINESRDYTNFLPIREIQVGIYFDTLACVSFSALNCIETILNVRGLNINYSDRFLAKMSGTTKQGNYIYKVADTLVKDAGSVKQEDWNFIERQRTPIVTWDEFYAEIPQAIQMLGKQWLNQWDVKWEWVNPDDVKEALKFGPLQVSVYAWPLPDENGIFHEGGNKARNHMVTLYGYEEGQYMKIYDHYDNIHKKLEWDYPFGHAVLFTIKHKSNITPMPIIDIPNDTLVQEVEKSGTFGLHLNKKILLGDKDAILATWEMRNGKSAIVRDVTGKDIKVSLYAERMPLTKEQWDSFPKQDLKGNPIE